MGLVRDRSQEEDHARLWDDTKLKLKQPNLDGINPSVFAVKARIWLPVGFKRIFQTQPLKPTKAH